MSEWALYEDSTSDGEVGELLVALFRPDSFEVAGHGQSRAYFVYGLLNNSRFQILADGFVDANSTILQMHVSLPKTDVRAQSHDIISTPTDPDRQTVQLHKGA